MIADDALLEEFQRLTHEVLSYDGPRGILAGLVSELVAILESAASLPLDSQESIEAGETLSTSGLAISPTQAAMCAGEEQRTAFFLRGLHSAIAAAIEKNPDRPIRVLYAGCGPYATLATPLMSIFPYEKVRFTLLDIHPVSVDSARSVIHHLGLEASVEAFVTTDACAYTIPPDAIPDVIVSETMSTALEKEPQVAILRHLHGQAPAAALVPESVQIDAFLVDTAEEPDRFQPSPDQIALGPVFELSTKTIRSWTSRFDDRLPAATINLPVPPNPSYRAFLFTTITTHGEHVLRTHDCNLTGIREVTEVADCTTACSIQFHYQLGADPHLAATLVP